jgi:hypothetical protein
MEPCSQIPGPKILLVGESGSGKTYSIRTLVDAGVTPFIIFTENSMRTLVDIPDEKCHWHYIPSGDIEFSDQRKILYNVNKFSYEQIAEMKQGIQKDKFTQALDLMDLFDDFTCDRCKKSFGPVKDFGTDKCLVIDSLTDLSRMLRLLTQGAKPTLHQGEWNVAMNALENLLNLIIAKTWCGVVITAHPEREMDPNSGKVRIYPSSIGAKLSPKIPRMFDDVLFAEFGDKGYTWSAQHPQAVTKTRNLHALKNKESLPPSYKLIYDEWKKAGGTISTLTPNSK